MLLVLSRKQGGKQVMTGMPDEKSLRQHLSEALQRKRNTQFSYPNLCYVNKTKIKYLVAL